MAIWIVTCPKRETFWTPTFLTCSPVPPLYPPYNPQRSAPMAPLDTSTWRPTRLPETSLCSSRGGAAARTTKRCAEMRGSGHRSFSRPRVSRIPWRRTDFSPGTLGKIPCTARTTGCTCRTARWTCTCWTRRLRAACCSFEAGHF